MNTSRRCEWCQGADGGVHPVVGGAWLCLPCASEALEGLKRGELPAVPEPPEAREAVGAEATEGRLTFTSANTIRPEAVRWAWRHRVPLGALTLLAGRQGLGKSTLTMHLAASLSRGELEGDLTGQSAGTLIVTFEDNGATTIVPRLIAAGADLERVRIVGVARSEDGLVSLPDDLGEIEAGAVEHGARLLVIDPVVASLPGKIDAHRDQDVRRALAPLAGLAERAGLAVIGLMHLNKGAGLDPLTRVSGSTGFTAAARSVLAFGTDPSDVEGESNGARVLAQSKSNLAREASALAYRIEGREITDDAGATIETSRLVLVGECDAHASELLGVPSAEDRREVDDATEFLADELAVGDWVPKANVQDAAKATGHAWRTVQRAKQRLGVLHDRQGFPSITMWRLPVAPVGVGATGVGATGATAKNPVATGQTGSETPQSRQQTMTGATGAENGRKASDRAGAPSGRAAVERVATPAEDAEAQRVAAKLEGWESSP